MSYKLDYSESAPKVVERLANEHREIESKLSRIGDICSNYEDGKLKVALSLLRVISTEILRHAVEEEAIVARAIMRSEETRVQSGQSVKILQAHREIKAFLEDRLPQLGREKSEKEVRGEMLGFIHELAAHHRAEEEVLFPLALKADLLLEKNRRKNGAKSL